MSSEEKKKILVVEDSWEQYEKMKKLLRKMGFAVEGYTKSYNEAIEKIEKEHPYLALVDLRLDGVKNGIDLARELKHKYKIPFFYLTAYADEELLADTSKIGNEPYMVKSAIDETQLMVNIQKVVSEKSGAPDSKAPPSFVFIKDQYQLIKIELNKILFIEAAENYVLIHTAEKKHMIHKTMKDMEDELPMNDFARVHRKYIVRLDKIKSIPGNYIKMENGAEVSIGESYKENLLQRLNLL